MAHLSDIALRDLLKAIEDDEVALPTLPEVALAVREAAESPDVSISQLASVIGTDTALTARILKVVNSPLLRSGWEITDLQAAIGRLGVIYTSNLAVGLAMEQMFCGKSKAVDGKLRDIWKKSLLVAGVCYSICRHRSDLKADQALLAGLVHMIGVLPILTYADHHNELHTAPADLDSVIERIHPQIGFRILEQWDFPAQLTAVPRGYADLTRRSGALDYVDVVQAAALITSLGGESKYAAIDWDTVPGIQALGLKRSDVHLYLEEATQFAV
ncbi:histidine kinase [Pseudomonas aeruginosa]|uniref:HDOD domain-containing protein n=1 Tax=Pseudomonas aeruginosa TaxID=287 RepID=UPI00071B2696|nr:HDOD domain-containing protein [Pseudomonas aeruginosa]KSQ21807.1 histidine kinase [Pseudomonas aeruginosa]RPV61486.1 HDOD domain-containing protein [Pseudomonas aeruginosa]